MPSQRKKRKISETPAKLASFEAEILKKRHKTPKKNIKYQQVIGLSAATPHPNKKSRASRLSVNSDAKENAPADAKPTGKQEKQSSTQKKPLSIRKQALVQTPTPAENDDENIPLSQVFARSIGQKSTPKETTDEGKAPPQTEGASVDPSPIKDIENAPLSKVFARSLKSLSKSNQSGQKQRGIPDTLEEPKSTQLRKARKSVHFGDKDKHMKQKGDDVSDKTNGQEARISLRKAKHSEKLKEDLQPMTKLMVESLNPKKRLLLPQQDSQEKKKTRRQSHGESPTRQDMKETSVEAAPAPCQPMKCLNNAREKQAECGSPTQKKKKMKKRRMKEKGKRCGEPPMLPLRPLPVPSYPTSGDCTQMLSAFEGLEDVEPSVAIALVLDHEMKVVSKDACAYRGHTTLLQHMGQYSTELFEEVSKITDFAPPTDFQVSNEMLTEQICILRQLLGRLQDEQKQWHELEEIQMKKSLKTLCNGKEQLEVDQSACEGNEDQDFKANEASITKLSKTIEDSIEEMVIQVDVLKSNLRDIETSCIEKARLSQTKIYESYEGCQFAGYLDVEDPISLIKKIAKK